LVKTQNTPEVRAAIPSLRVTKARKDRHTRVSIKQQVQLKVEATHPWWYQGPTKLYRPL